MNKLQELKKLLNSLSNNEFRDLYQGLKIKTVNYNKDTSLKILDILNKNPQIESTELQNLVYGKLNTNAINKILARISSRIYDSFILRENIESNELYDNRARDIFSLEKELLISEILRYRGLFNLSNEKIDNVIYLCKYYEHYDILLTALEKKKRWLYPKDDQKLKIKLENEINIYSNESVLYRQSVDIYFKTLKFSFEEFDTKNKSSLIRYLHKVTSNYEKSNSNLIKLYMYYVKIQYYRFLLQHKKALQLVDELIEHISNSKNIYSKVRLGNALLNKGVFYRYCFSYDLSIQYILESKRYLSDQKQNNILIYEHLILTYLFQANLVKLKYYLSIFEKEYIADDTIPAHVNTYNYYKGLLCIFIGDYVQAYIYLNNAIVGNEIYLMNLECRILMIIVLIETAKFDLADNVIENMRKYFSRFNNLKFNFRSKELALRILTKLSLNSYNFQIVENNEKVLIKELENMLHTYCFHNYEILLFHEWFASKVKGIPYDHAEAMKKLKKLNKAHV
jgi:hypothetical protein